MNLTDEDYQIIYDALKFEGRARDTQYPTLTDELVRDVVWHRGVSVDEVRSKMQKENPDLDQ